MKKITQKSMIIYTTEKYQTVHENFIMSDSPFEGAECTLVLVLELSRTNGNSSFIGVFHPTDMSKLKI